MNCAPILLQINPEVPKLMGRALLHANQPENRCTLLLLGQQTVPNDVEVYFHLGQCYQALGNIPAAQRCLNQCLLMSPDFRPAQWLLDSLVTPPSPQ
ncbi:MAG: hypothetical protein U0003_04670 [Vampirovibrionales bacterium]